MTTPARMVSCALALFIGLGLSAAGGARAAGDACRGGTVTADVVAIDQPFFYNRLGANLPSGMTFALRRDVCVKDARGTVPDFCPGTTLDDLLAAITSGGPGVALRASKRPRPLVLRVNQEQCLDVRFTNLLTPVSGGTSTYAASVHVQGMQWAASDQDDGSWVGGNANSLVDPGQTRAYRLFAEHEGSYLLYSAGDTFSALPAGLDGGQLAQGLFGAVNVQPAGAEYYRSQVTREDLRHASRGFTAFGQPIPDYRAVYPKSHPRAGTPVLAMLDCPGQRERGCPEGGELVHSDLTALITGRDPETGRPGRFPIGEREAALEPSYSLPDRRQPYREFTIIYHEVFQAVQAFAPIYGKVLNVDGFGADNFAFNYGIAGIGSEILANRLGVGPMGECTGCKYEEFFLSSWTVGDPAMIVDHPATNNTVASGVCSDTGFACDPNAAGTGCANPDATCLVSVERKPSTEVRKATKVLYPDDPSNVYHSYLSDHTKFRVLHGGQDLHHIHHQHAHQWLGTPDSPDGDYLDSQTIGPGSSFTMEMVYNGSGNVNQTVGDSIFHCHFYPHFAMGMWSLWRVHDVYETGTELDQGRPKTARDPRTGETVTVARALPDGEIEAGTPIPAVVPLPTLAMPPMPGRVVLTDRGRRIALCPEGGEAPADCVSNMATAADTRPGAVANPGYPFYVPGLGGQRAPHPPLDFAKQNGETLDGGLPRHVLRPCATDDCFETPPLNFWDFSKTLVEVDAFELPEEGTWAEKLAMDVHAVRLDHDTETPEGDKQPFVRNGLPPVAGAPYADPCIDYRLEGGAPPGLRTRDYLAADIQVDAVFNKEGWHFPQLRMISLWGDVEDTLTGKRPPEPLFFRVNSGECVSYTLANLVPNVYELDDFQVRTPTDILGQHIHLVKFDVTSSDGAANGFNYEDGTFAPDEVTERIQAINRGGGLSSTAEPDGPRRALEAKTLPFFGAGPGGRWMGAQATVQRFYADPLLNGRSHDPAAPGAEDRTIRTVFTHDHFSPSTHQQAGLYAGLVVEPATSKWFYNEEPGKLLGGEENCRPIAGCERGAQGVCLDCDPIPSRVVTGPGGVEAADGGPTSWQAVIQPQDEAASFREFLLAFQDTTLTYEPFGTLDAPAAKGFCSKDPTKTCTPATVAEAADVSGCGDAGAVCYAYGFCSDNPKVRCMPGTSTSLADVSACDNPELATCNLVAGIPGQPVAGYALQHFGAAAENDPLAPVFTWGTVPIDAPGKAGPEIISLSGGTYSFSLNYRNEPLFPRINAAGSTSTNEAGDLAYAYASIERGTLADGGFCAGTNTQCTTDADCDAGVTCQPLAPPYKKPLTADVRPGDPFTPLLRTYAGDDVQVRTLVGAHINPHNFTIHGVKWLLEPSLSDSGWRASQVMSISEHFEQVFRMPPWTGDAVYMAGAAAIEQAGGNWGLMRAYGEPRRDLTPLPQNEDPSRSLSVCPERLEPPYRKRRYDVIATTVEQATGGGLVYNSRYGISDANGLAYFNAARMYDASAAACQGDDPRLDECPCTEPGPWCRLRPELPMEPLVLRANAGDCIEVTLYNFIDASQLGPGADAPNVPPIEWTTPLFAPAACGGSGQQPCLPSNVSASVGLNPQLVTYDVSSGDGFNAGVNPAQTVAPNGDPVTYVWYAGNVDPTAEDPHVPIEFGGANLLPADVVNHYQHGLFGALVIEPEGSEWDPAAGATTRVMLAGGETFFREQVLITQDGLQSPPSPPSLVNDALNAVNYKSEPLFDFNTGGNYRSCPEASGVACVLSDEATCCTAFDSNGNCTSTVPCGEPETPIVHACAGDQVRLRLLHPGGINTNEVFELYGHVWAETPYQSFGRGCEPATTQTNLYASSVISDEHSCDNLGLDASEWVGSRPGHGPTNHFEVLIDKAGGEGQVPGDYLYRSYPAMHYRLGMWGIFRVHGPGSAVCEQGTSM